MGFQPRGLVTLRNARGIKVMISLSLFEDTIFLFRGTDKLNAREPLQSNIDAKKINADTVWRSTVHFSGVSACCSDNTLIHDDRYIFCRCLKIDRYSAVASYCSDATKFNDDTVCRDVLRWTDHSSGVTACCCDVISSSSLCKISPFSSARSQK